MRFENEIPPYAIPLSGFDAEKAINLCALFLRKAGGHLEKLKLVKLLYLSEREFFDRHEEPMMWDEFYSLPHGPICSSALNIIDRVIETERSEPFFVIYARKDVYATRGAEALPLDFLSAADTEVVEHVWNRHGDKTASQLRNFTHDYCEEYVEVMDGRVPISYEGLMKAIGNERAEEVSHEIDSYRSVLARYA